MMEHEIPHDLQLEKAREVAQQAVQHYAERFAKYSPQVTWTDEQRVAVAFTVKGVRLEGGITVEPGVFRMRLEVPFLLRPFTGRALEAIDTEVQRWIAKAKAAAV
jgi:hypothetical protein